MRNIYRGILKKARVYLMQGDRYYCPLCNHYFRSFLPGGTSRLPQVRCLNCDSLKRHRILWLALQNIVHLDSKEKKLLHVAPENCLANRLKQKYDYLSVDIEADNAMQKMDICNIPLPDATFDVILCNHVLEHIPNDKKALTELFRVLKPNGWASIQVPVFGKQTQEDLTITKPQIRTKLYGQSDRVRQYGRDFQERLKSSGFQVTTISTKTLVQPEDIRRMSLGCETDLFICRK